jgi:rSAM/selenodomain-associated transferase 2
LARASELSIIIPARNEQQTIAGVLRSLARQDRISECQVLVVDGGSTDGTEDIVSAFPFVELIRCERGLARQMNRGAEVADGKALWFLHADVTLPNSSTVGYIIETLSDPQVVGGACRFQIRGHDMYFRFINALVNMRSRWLGRAYGDQGIFMRKDIFTRTGGFRDVPCTDLDMFLRLRSHGEVEIISPVVATSARTWQRHGKVKTTAWHIKEWLTYEWNRKKGRLDSAA